jgi:hypothetical protein
VGLAVRSAGTMAATALDDKTSRFSENLSGHTDTDTHSTLLAPSPLRHVPLWEGEALARRVG